MGKVNNSLYISTPIPPLVVNRLMQKRIPLFWLFSERWIEFHYYLLSIIKVLC